MTHNPTQTHTDPKTDVPISRGTRIMNKILDGVERAGNKLPQPVTLFVLLIVIVLLGSWIASAMNISAIHPRDLIHGDPADAIPVKAINLLNKEGLRRIFSNLVTTFTGFPPLGMVLTVMLGIGVADRSGLITASLKGFVNIMPPWAITSALLVAGMLSSLASDAGYVVLIPLGAVLFKSLGRHPLAGLATAFAGVSGGFGANLIFTSLDPLLAGFTESAAQMIDPAYTVSPAANWYFMAASVPIIALAGTFVTEKILEPRLGQYNPQGGSPAQQQAEGADTDAPAGEDNKLTKLEKKGLMAAGATILIYVLLIFLATIEPGGVFRAENGDLKPFFTSMVAIMFFLFLLPGIAYGIVTRTIRSDKDVNDMASKAMAGMGTYIVLAFVAAQFVAFFNWSNLGVISAIKGAGLLQSVGFTGIPLMITFVIIASLINILIGSASAKWAILAPIFVPMLMLMGFSPELTQAAYRIGDSYTNILTPLLPYFPLIMTVAQKYEKQMGIGTLISSMLPYSIAFVVVRIPMLAAWILLDLPLGPGSPLFYHP